MELLIIKILVIWSVSALIVGLGAGAAIGRGERLLNDEILTALFVATSGQQVCPGRGVVLLQPAKKEIFEPTPNREQAA